MTEIDTLIHHLQRNPYFSPSGFEPQEQINILEAKGENKKRLEKIKGRKRAEKKLLKRAKHNDEHKLYDRIIEVHKIMTGKKINVHKTHKIVTKEGVIELHKQAKICNKRKPSKTSINEGQIQYGFDLAKWWGEQHGL